MRMIQNHRQGKNHMRKVVCLLGLVFLVSLSAAAQDVPKVDLFAGYTYVHTGPEITIPSFNANGGVGSVAFNLTNWGSLVLEVGGIHASEIGGADVDATAYTYMAGPKITLFHRSKLSPFAEALFGFAHTNAGFNRTTLNHNNFAMSPGVGLDWNPTRHLGIRLGQLDYLLTRVPTSTNQVDWNNFRYSAGVVFRL
jgi:opacity protein-like surface antigen